MNNLTIQKKLIIALIIPIIGLVYFTLQIAITNLNENKQLIVLDSFLDKSLVISELVHELQKERARSTGYIGSRTDKLKKQLIEQRKLTDKKIEKLFNYINTDKQIANMDTSSMMKPLFFIDILRDEVDEGIISFKNALNFYTDVNRDFINHIDKYYLLNKNNKVSQKFKSYINLLRAKESAGEERGILNYVFSSGKINFEIYRRCSILNSIHTLYINNYKVNIGIDELKYYDSFISKELEDDVDYYREIVSSRVIKSKIISNIKAMSGYGGLIHNFKNYILRSDIEYYNKFKLNYKNIKLQVKEYVSMRTTTADEKILINVVLNTFDKYDIAIEDAVQLKKNTIALIELDSKVKIDDEFAILSLNNLSNNVIGVDSNIWFDLSTQRINKLKEIENNLTLDMKNIITELIDDSYSKFLLYLFIAISFIIITLIISIGIINTITNSIKEINLGLVSFFDYLMNKSDTFATVNIKSNDEFGTIAKIINKDIENTKIYLENSIKEETSINQQKDKTIYEQSKLASMGEMIGNIAHHWRQPLSVISTGVTGMQLQKEYGLLSDKEFNETCDAINNSVQDLSTTIDNFRNYMITDDTHISFDVANNIKSFLHVAEPFIKEENINIDIDLDENISIMGSPNEFVQSFMNLFNNSKDAFILNNIDRKYIFITLRVKKDSFIITYKDNAGGIEEDKISKVFEPYYTTKHKSQGTGLGLSMVHNLVVDTMKGSIVVTNEVYNHEEIECKGLLIKIVI